MQFLSLGHTLSGTILLTGMRVCICTSTRASRSLPSQKAHIFTGSYCLGWTQKSHRLRALLDPLEHYSGVALRCRLPRVDGFESSRDCLYFGRLQPSRSTPWFTLSFGTSVASWFCFGPSLTEHSVRDLDETSGALDV